MSATLFQTSLESGSRIALILLDNCIEFMFKHIFVDFKKVVGVSKKYPIKPTEWESETSRRFSKLVEAMEKYGGLSQDYCDAALHYHSINDDLYHTEISTKPTDSIFREQLKFVLNIIGILFEVKYTPKLIKVLLESGKPFIITETQAPSSNSLEEDFKQKTKTIDKKYRSS